MSEQITIEKSLRDWWSRVKAGQVGALPALLGLLVLCLVFGSMSSVFLTPGNFANLLTQAAAVIVIAMGLVFVLLLGLLVHSLSSQHRSWHYLGRWHWLSCCAIKDSIIRRNPCNIPRFPGTFAFARW
ncbi:MAG: hypothetical protein RL155_941 [Actinomycetota bacterium]